MNYNPNQLEGFFYTKKIKINEICTLNTVTNSPFWQQKISFIFLGKQYFQKLQNNNKVYQPDQPQTQAQPSRTHTLPSTQHKRQHRLFGSYDHYSLLPAKRKCLVNQHRRRMLKRGSITIRRQQH